MEEKRCEVDATAKMRYLKDRVLNWIIVGRVMDVSVKCASWLMANWSS
jgi:hypothetical protein